MQLHAITDRLCQTGKHKKLEPTTCNLVEYNLTRLIHQGGDSELGITNIVVITAIIIIITTIITGITIITIITNNNYDY